MTPFLRPSVCLASDVSILVTKGFIWWLTRLGRSMVFLRASNPFSPRDVHAHFFESFLLRTVCRTCNAMGF